MEEGESTSVHHEVVWEFIAMMVPLVLTTTGWRLWQEGYRRPWQESVCVDLSMLGHVRWSEQE